MVESIFVQLALILLTAFIIAYILRVFKQPIVIGYIIAGIVISPFIIELGASQGVISIFSELGIAFLLFIVGLHLNPKIIKEVGVSSLVIGLAQIVLTFGFGFLIAWKLLSFGIVTSSYIGIALAFSSTIIVTKLLSDRKQLDSLYGKISLGILIVQDLVAIGVLMFLSSLSNGTSFTSMAFKSFLAGGALVVVIFLVGYFVLPRVIRGIARSHELLFLFSVVWFFLVIASFVLFNFSIEIGALMAGIALSVSPYSVEISARIRPLRDFFLILFFIILGLNVQISGIGKILFDAVILSVAVLILKPVILMTLSALFGYTKRTNFLVGTTLAQISEFSFIILTLGFSLGHITKDVLTTITLTGILTITLSTYLIIYSNKFYEVLGGALKIFERKKIRRERKIHKSYDAILFGYNRIGFSILNALKKIGRKYLVVDFNPDIISDLTKLRIPSLYGDIYDVDLLSELPLDKLKLAISTVPDFETNCLLLETIKAENPNAIVILRAHQIADALELYKKGASYVLTPHFLGGEYIANMIRSEKMSDKKYEEEKAHHIKMLKERLAKGQEHPEVEKD